LLDKGSHTDSQTLRDEIVKGSVTAFEHLFLDMYPALHRMAWRLTQQEDAAKDIVSDVFLKIWENHEGLSHVKDIRSYLYSTVRNHTLNYLKKLKRATQRVDSSNELPEDQADEDSLQALLNAETVRLLMAAIGTLPKECEKVVLLGLEGYSTSEIAAQLGVSAPAVSQQKARAVRLLRAKLGTAMVYALSFFLD
jgi:RNA polymerase sigma-70 factor (ECF subfamily)